MLFSLSLFKLVYKYLILWTKLKQVINTLKIKLIHKSILYLFFVPFLKIPKKLIISAADAI